MPAPRECEWLPRRQVPLLAAMYLLHLRYRLRACTIPVTCMGIWRNLDLAAADHCSIGMHRAHSQRCLVAAPGVTSSVK